MICTPFACVGPAEFRKPFDIGHAAVARTHLRRHARRHAEGKAREAQHGQRIDLPRLGAVRIDEDDVAADQFLFQRLDAAGAVFLGVDGELHVLGRDHRAAGAACEMIGFAQEIGQPRRAHAHLLRIARHARRFVDHARRAAAIEMLEAVRTRHAREHAQQLAAIGIVAIGRRREIRLHLEELGEIGIELAQAIVKPRLAEQHDLDVERNGFGLDGHRLAAVENLGEVGDADLRLAQRALQRLPRNVLLQEIERIDQQKAAIGRMQRARADEHEIGDHGDEQRHVLDLAQQLRQRGKVQRQNRRALPALIVDEQIHLIAVERHVAAFVVVLVVAAGFGLQRIDMDHHVLEDGFEMRVRLGMAVIGVRQRLHQPADFRLAQFAIERAQLLERLLARAVQATASSGRARPCSSRVRSERRSRSAFGIWRYSSSDSVRPSRCGAKSKPSLAFDQRQAHRLRFAADLFERAFDGAPVIVFDGAALLAILVALEELRHRVLERVDELAHDALEHRALACRKTQRERPMCADSKLWT